MSSRATLLASDLVDFPHRLGPNAASAICPLTFRRPREGTLAGTIRQFLESQAAGCSLCCLILSAVDAAKPGWIAENQGLGSIRAARSVGNEFLCQLWTSDGIVFTYDFTCSIFTLTDNPHEDLQTWISTRSDSADPVATRIIPDSSSKAAFSRISDWLSSCVRKHGTSCHGDPYFPRRVLDVGLFSDGEFQDSDVIQLIQFTRSSTRSQDNYIALSYCWGPEAQTITKTTRANLPSYLSGIALRSLPQTIQDAVTVCRNLRVRYLWVDCICIVQDDEEDWKQESAQMRAIYSSSYLTIAAHVGASAHDGFLGLQIYGQPAWQTEIQASTKTFFGDDADVLTTFLLRMGDSRKETSPLEFRGWTMQECILSPRIVHFTRNEMIWECNERHVCECLNLLGGSVDHAMLKTRTMLQSLTPIARLEREPPHQRWEMLVELYTRRKLSYESDKLVAIAALAQMTAASYLSTWARAAGNAGRGEDGDTTTLAKIGGIYIAGLFLDALPRHLLWRTGEVAIGDAQAAEYATLRDSSWGRRPLRYRAPTWSWASVNTPIAYNFLPDKPIQSRITVHRQECFSALATKTDPTGPVTYAQLSLQGRAVPVKLFTADYYGNQLIDSDFESNSNWMSTATAVRSSNGYWVRVATDLRRDGELTSSDAAYRCWKSGGCNPEDKGPTGNSHCKQCGMGGDDWDEANFCCFQVAVGSYAVYFLVLQRSTRTGKSWERIAIGMDWINSTRLFEAAEDRTLRIV